MPAKTVAKTTERLPAEAGSHGVVDIQAFIDARPVSLQKQLLFLCFVVIAIDGFDTAIIASSRRRCVPSGVSPSPSSARCLPRDSSA